MRSELFKLRTVWTTWVLLGITAVLVGGLSSLIGFVPHRHQEFFPARGSVPWFDGVFSVLTVALNLALVLGAVMMTSEHRHKTVTPTFLAEPRRGRVAAAKLAVAGLAGLAVAVVAGVVGLLFGFGVVAGGIAPSGRMLTEFGHIWPGVAAACVLFCAYGVGLGALLKNQAVAVVVGLVATTVVEPIVTGVAPSVGRWFPSAAARALESVVSSPAVRHAFGGGLAHPLAWWVGALALLAYGVVLAAAGSVTTLRADVT